MQDESPTSIVFMPSESAITFPPSWPSGVLIDLLYLSATNPVISALIGGSTLGLGGLGIGYLLSSKLSPKAKRNMLIASSLTGTALGSMLPFLLNKILQKVG